MKEKTDKCVYTTDDLSLNISGREVIYPITAFLEKNLKSADEVKILLLIKKDEAGHYQKNAADFVEEILSVNKEINAKIEHKYIETDFSEEQSIHEQLMGRIVEEIDNDSHIIADITYGPKDLPIVLFSALNFAEKFLGCEIDNIIYGQANFVDGKPVNTKICDMVPLYYLNSVTNTIRCDNPDKARKMLKSLLSF
jgi:hypothetical protein